ncbi:hypothetical protein ACFWIA_28040 [Streptomyces sp. NPDC127068]|uniref:hypothetical protein n=1 Tax=Streptomyces sp. NPDC127068 TaxID=3347127 RepID=UPI003666D1D8
MRAYAAQDRAAIRPGPAGDRPLAQPGHRGPPGGADGVGLAGWEVPALHFLGFGGPEPVVGQLSLEVAWEFLGRYAFTRPPTAGLRPLRDPSTDEKAADDEKS